MATISKQIPTSRASYPWERWFDGKSYDLTRGTDFQILPHNLKAMIYQAAKRFNLRAVVNVIDENTVRVQTFPLSPPEKKAKPAKSAGGKHRKV